MARLSPTVHRASSTSSTTLGLSLFLPVSLSLSLSQRTDEPVGISMRSMWACPSPPQPPSTPVSPAERTFISALLSTPLISLTPQPEGQALVNMFQALGGANWASKRVRASIELFDCVDCSMAVSRCYSFAGLVVRRSMPQPGITLYHHRTRVPVTILRSLF